MLSLLYYTKNHVDFSKIPNISLQSSISEDGGADGSLHPRVHDHPGPGHLAVREPLRRRHAGGADRGLEDSCPVIGRTHCEARPLVATLYIIWDIAQAEDRWVYLQFGEFSPLSTRGEEGLCAGLGLGQVERW